MLVMKVEMDLKVTMVTPVKQGNKEEVQAELDESRQQFADEMLEEMKQSAGSSGEVEMKSFNATIIEV